MTEIALTVVIDEEPRSKGLAYRVMTGSKKRILQHNDFEQGLVMDGTELRKLIALPDKAKRIQNKVATKRIQQIRNSVTRCGVVKVERSRWEALLKVAGC